MALTPVPTIDPALPVPPNPADDEAVFDAKAYAWSEALPGFGSDVKAIGDATYANAQWAQTKAGEAATQVGLAAAQVSIAAGHASNASASANNAADSATAASESATEAEGLVEKYQGALAADPVLDKSGGPLTDGDWYVSTVTGFIRAYTVAGGWVNGLSAVAGVTSVNGNSGAITGVVTETGSQSLTEKTLVNPLLFLGGSNGTAGQVPISQGSGLPVIWGSGSEIIRSVRTSNTAISAANKGNLIDITSGTFTQTFSAISALGNGWFCYIRNAGTGDITLDTNASELIDGLTSYVMYPGEVRLVQCDGVALRSIVLNAFYKVATSSGNFIKPPGYSRFEGEIYAAGASGGKENASITIPGGGGGACAPFSYRAYELAATEAFIIGAGGAPQTINAQPGNPGGNSTFKSTSAFGGGAGGVAGGSAYIQGLTISATSNHFIAGANAVADVAPAYLGGAISSISTGRSPTIRGGGAGGAINNFGVLSQYGTTIYGGAGGAASLAGNGVDGTAPGGGGGATKTGAKSGAGARGELRICGVI